MPSANWYTTPDGRYLLFASTSELTSYDTTEASPGDCPEVEGDFANGHCYEVYRYDSGSSSRPPSLTCVSCDPSGAAPVSNSLFERSATRTAPAAGPVRAMSDDGAYAFFDTADALVPADANETLDVYESHEGTVSLISSGEDAHPSFFLGASSYVDRKGETIEAGNVFIGTHANLLPREDTESQGNVYDARICEAEDPCIAAPPGETTQCLAGECQKPPPAPIDATPGSMTFLGAATSSRQSSPRPRQNRRRKRPRRRSGPKS